MSDLQQQSAKDLETIEQLQTDLTEEESISKQLVFDCRDQRETIEQLQARVDGYRQNAGFYKSCALSGEVPKDGAEPFTPPEDNTNG